MEINWLLGFIGAGISGFVLMLVALAIGQLVIALLFGIVCLTGVAGAVFMMGRYP